jgi:hypothetical protein
MHRYALPAGDEHLAFGADILRLSVDLTRMTAPTLCAYRIGDRGDRGDDCRSVSELWGRLPSSARAADG